MNSPDSLHDYGDFRIVGWCPSGSKKNSMSYDSTNGIARYRFTLGEVLSWNIDFDVIVGNGMTRITLKEVPRFLVDALNVVMTEGLQLDGIFRKEGNSARLNRQEIQEVYRGVRPIPPDFTVLDVCTMVKRFLKDLKPTLLNSEDVRHKLIERAKRARLSGEFKLTHQEMARMFETPTRQLSPAHIGTLGYLMRILRRIANHSDTHKMTTDNLAVVLVGSVFGDFIAGGGTESRKKMQQLRKSLEAELIAKKEEMGIQVAAVKLLIVNANMIALPKSHYVSSNDCAPPANIRSMSAMPNIRCTSVSETNQEKNAPYSGTVFSMAKASLNQRPLTRRDSDLTHVKNGKPRDTTTKRSSSFLPIASLRGLRDKMSNQFLKRNKSPSPEKNILFQPRRQFFRHDSSVSSPFLMPSSPMPTTSRLASGFDESEEESAPVFSSVDRRGGEVALQKKGSTSSGRKSRAHTKKGNINAALRAGRRGSDVQKSFLCSPNEKRTSGSSSTNSTLTTRSLRRFSQSEQNSFNGDTTPPLEKKKKKTVIARRNTADGLSSSSLAIKHRRATFWGVDTIDEEKENRQSVVLERESEEEQPAECSVFDAGQSVLEMMNQQARLRRIGVVERRRRLAKYDAGGSESMIVLNGSMVTFDKLASVQQKASEDEKEKSPVSPEQETNYPQSNMSSAFNTPVRSREPFRAMSAIGAKSRIGMQLEREMKQRLDVVATPMLSRRTVSEPVAHRISRPISGIPPNNFDRVGVQCNGQVWVGKTQTVSSTVPRSVPEVEHKKLSPILAQSPVFRSSSVFSNSSKPTVSSAFGIRSKSHLTEERLFREDYAAYVTPPRASRVHRSPNRPCSNLIYFTPKTQRRAKSPLSALPQPRPILRSSSSFAVSPPSEKTRAISSPRMQRSSVDEPMFKCPLLPPMKSHEAKESKETDRMKTPKSTDSSIDHSELGFGDYNEILKTSTEDTKFPFAHQLVEARPSVTMLRSSRCGLVQSRINHFQDIERNHRVSDFSSSAGRFSTVSQTSLKSIETISSSGGTQL